MYVFGLKQKTSPKVTSPKSRKLYVFYKFKIYNCSLVFLVNKKTSFKRLLG